MARRFAGRVALVVRLHGVLVAPANALLALELLHLVVLLEQLLPELRGLLLGRRGLLLSRRNLRLRR